LSRVLNGRWRGQSGY